MLRQKHRERPEREKSGISRIGGMGGIGEMGVRKSQGGGRDKGEADKKCN